MPRLTPSLIRRAGRISAHLATLLPACRTIEAARCELRWIREHVAGLSHSQSQHQIHIHPHSPHRTSPRCRSHSRNHGSTAEFSDSRPETGTRKEIEMKRIRSSKDGKAVKDENKKEKEALVSRLIARRGAGEPLQYVLGSQPFSDLDILCAKGVLIPRPETEAWTAMLGDLVFGSPYFSQVLSRVDECTRRAEGKKEEEVGDADKKRVVRILDLCSGTGCIGLALNKHGTTSGYNPRIVGVDIEPRAVRLARRNLARNFPVKGKNDNKDDKNTKAHTHIHQNARQSAVAFKQADIFAANWMERAGLYADIGNPFAERSRDQDQQQDQERQRQERIDIDILVSNPPYISQRGFAVDTARSVRHYEPKLALVPPLPPLPSISPPPTSPSHTSASPSNTSTSTSRTPTSAHTPDRPACAPEDIFYARLLSISSSTLRPRVATFEVGDMQQAVRVVELALTLTSTQPLWWDIVEIWRDWPDCPPAEHRHQEGGDDSTVNDNNNDTIRIAGREIPVRGSGHGRVVFLARRETMLGNKFANRGFKRDVYVG
ncbi:S-adenosyl-L-methionine-dependent methyltransferase [Nemania sp. FL0916]|nr:S-adenosyl-L-methionine-dependent methyltransferase [Nemania sp. FL0916]